MAWQDDERQPHSGDGVSLKLSASSTGQSNHCVGTYTTQCRLESMDRRLLPALAALWSAVNEVRRILAAVDLTRLDGAESQAPDGQAVLGRTMRNDDPVPLGLKLGFDENWLGRLEDWVKS